MGNERRIVSANDLTDNETLDLGQALGAMKGVSPSLLCTTVVEITHSIFNPKGDVNGFVADYNRRIARLLRKTAPKNRTEN